MKLTPEQFQNTQNLIKERLGVRQPQTFTELVNGLSDLPEDTVRNAILDMDDYGQVNITRGRGNMLVSLPPILKEDGLQSTPAGKIEMQQGKTYNLDVKII